jgi:hypothetical protein
MHHHNIISWKPIYFRCVRATLAVFSILLLLLLLLLLLRRGGGSGTAPAAAAEM